LRVYRDLATFQRFGRPLLVPVSRKTVIGDILGVPAPERDAGTIACIVAAQLRGAQIFRVHNVRAAAQAVRMVEAIQSAD
jgi:dihydropteroate synthase